VQQSISLIVKRGKINRNLFAKKITKREKNVNIRNKASIAAILSTPRESVYLFNHDINLNIF